MRENAHHEEKESVSVDLPLEIVQMESPNQFETVKEVSSRRMKGMKRKRAFVCHRNQHHQHQVYVVCFFLLSDFSFEDPWLELDSKNVCVFVVYVEMLGNNILMLISMMKILVVVVVVEWIEWDQVPVKCHDESEDPMEKEKSRIQKKLATSPLEKVLFGDVVEMKRMMNAR